MNIKEEALKEISEYTFGEIIYLDSPIHKNYLFTVRGKFCDFYKTSKYTMVYLKHDYSFLNLNTQLPNLARLTNFENFSSYWEIEKEKYRRLAEDTFYKFKKECLEIIEYMNNTDQKHFYKFHTN